MASQQMITHRGVRLPALSHLVPLNPPAPARPQVSAVALEPKKKAKRGKRSDQRETARA